ncbi:putative Ig domain-containing protein [Myceligenerans pegani]|uniref:Ig domain-containing protein n=1 Tax=Myceligenerans pegani TaxID=2776917 RepID=A0ABR9N5U6_9MICO|nr:putative Ig domain-containing protein [Myceligenerans sp. TRM 65318]MBE1879020.1 putative Ig domain-containing protein [Myceligenerans sp. TRM 65318]MBE3021291.1 putative Ig domain-containing protein [Myceligenerans sp. TRM 65318]
MRSNVASPLRMRLTALTVALVTGLGVPAASFRTAQAAEHEAIVTDNIVVIHETVSDAGFVHPGVGLSADDLRNAQEMVRSGQEPWASYFAAMADTGFASKTYRASNSRSAAEPDKALTDTYVHGGMRSRQRNDSFGSLTQALMWVMTGDEVYRRNAIQSLRAWADMNPDGYAYFPDAHIHTGHPLYQHLMAAEIIRATEPLADGSPGTYDGYDVVWSATDDANLLANYANPVVEVFNFSNKKWMNQHNFGLFGRIATAIYADDAEGYATGVEWTTVNSTYDGYDNGAIAPQIPLIKADDPANPYGYDFVQVREMGRDQAHGECNIDNFTGLARMLEVQGTKVDPVAGTVSTTSDAVSVYDFLDQRLLDGANQFFGFMLGARIPWVDERGEGWNGSVSEAYRGRMFNPVNELYYEYAYERGVDVEAEAPWVAELSSRLDGPYFYGGTDKVNFWSPGDKNPEYWVAFPEELAGTEPPALPDSPALTFEKAGLVLDEDTELVTEDGETFARASLSAEGTMSVISRVMWRSGWLTGLKYRSDGPASLDVLQKEDPSGVNPDEYVFDPIATDLELPDTGGEWRYITYAPAAQNVNFFRLAGSDDVTVDLHSVILTAATDLTAPQFEQADDTSYLTEQQETAVDLSASDAGGNVTHVIHGLPDGASFDAGTGRLTWNPARRQAGRHEVQVVADDGTTVAARTFELVVSKNRAKTIKAVVADGTDRRAVYTTTTDEPYREALRAAKDAADDGTDEEFEAALTALRDAIDALRKVNPRLEDGTLDFSDGVVTPTVITPAAVDTLAAGEGAGGGLPNITVGSFTLDFGPRYRVAADAFAFLAPFTFGNRMEGTNVYGSNDGIGWDLLTERDTDNTNEWDRIDVVDEFQGQPYRYLKLQVDNPGIETDPAYPGLWSFVRLRIDGDRTEVRGDIDTVSVSAPGSLASRVTEGDDVEVSFTSVKPITDVSVSVAGQDLAATSDDGMTWTATGTVGAVSGAGLLPVTIDHRTARGQVADTVRGSTDGTHLFGADESSSIAMGITTVVNASGEPDDVKAGQAALLFDGDGGTQTSVPAADGAHDLIWDFGEGSSYSLDRIDYLAAQNTPGMVRMPDMVFQGSNDLENWTTVAEQPFKTMQWQALDATDTGSYRYLRVSNSTFIDIAELRFHGSVDLDLEPVIARAEAVDLTAHSRASAILFTRELEAVKAAAAEPGADRSALAFRLLDAWDLLEPSRTRVPAAIDRSWVTASSVSWDNRRDAADNGWAMFDGDPATFTDTKTDNGWVSVIPTDGTVFTVEGVRYRPRTGFAPRASGVDLQGSDDGGATWTTFADTGAAAEGWNTVELAGSVEYGALRVSGSAGFANFAEVEFLVASVDRTGLELYLSETAALAEADWTADSWAALTAARDDAEAVAAADGASQEDVDAAAAALADTIAALVAA